MPEPAQFRVIQSGFLSTVQDLGRYGFQRFGMPVGGAMDILALRLGNRLVGNPDSAAVLEITLQGPELTFETDSVIALSGADLSPTLNGNPVQNWTVMCVTRGSTLSFGERRNGARAYLAVAGGINVPLVLGSRSTHMRSRTGGFGGRALLKGDVLHGHPPSSGTWKSAGRALPSAAHPSYPPDATLRVLLGPQSDCFVPDALGTLVHGPYTISPQSDRMGYRLIGPPLPHARAPDLISDAIPPGAVQIPASHQPI
ncbi:MAG: biotin-dependent carboxyltransferase family protein, partial [Nitrospirota bacterium]|nr:biotin-dependent carboxyltransferase family protein [Nitrospirota bacterium]